MTTHLDNSGRRSRPKSGFRRILSSLQRPARNLAEHVGQFIFQKWRLPRFTIVDLFYWVFVVAIVVSRCGRPGTQAPDAILVILLSLVVAICVRQFIGFFSPDSLFRRPDVRNALLPVILVRGIGCLILINLIFELVPDLPVEFTPDDGFDPEFHLEMSSAYLGLVLVMMPAFRQVSGKSNTAGSMFDNAVISLTSMTLIGVMVAESVLTNTLVFAAVHGIELATRQPASIGKPFLPDEHFANLSNCLFFSQLSIGSIVAALLTICGFQLFLACKSVRLRRIGIVAIVVGFIANLAFLLWAYNGGLQSLITAPYPFSFFQNWLYFGKLVAIVLVLSSIIFTLVFGSTNPTTCVLTEVDRNRADLPRFVYVLVPLVWFIGGLFNFDRSRLELSPTFFDNTRRWPDCLMPYSNSGLFELATATWFLKIALAAICISKFRLLWIFERFYRWFRVLIFVAMGIAFAFLSNSILDDVFSLSDFDVSTAVRFLLMGLVVVWAVMLVRKPRVTRERELLLAASPKEYVYLVLPSLKLWLLILPWTVAVMVTIEALLWSTTGLTLFVDLFDWFQ